MPAGVMEGCRDVGTETQRQGLRREAEVDGKRNKNKTGIKKQMRRERPRRTDRWRMKGSALTELFAGLPGPLCHPGESSRAAGLRASGRLRLWTWTLRCRPHLPFPFLTPSHSLPLYIFKPVQLPQPHPPTLPTGGGGWDLPQARPLRASSSSSTAAGRELGAEHKPVGLEGLGNKPQALGTEPTGLGAAGDLPTASGGSGPGAERMQGVRPVQRALYGKPARPRTGSRGGERAVVRPVGSGATQAQVCILAGHWVAA